MIKTILVPATGSDNDLSVHQSALATARLFEAHLDFLHVRVDPVAVAASMAAMDGGAGMLASGWLDQLAAEAEQRAKLARAAVERFCAAEQIKLDGQHDEPATVAARFHLEIGSETDAIVDHGRTADLLVIGRPSEGKGVGVGTLEAALFDSGRPVLIPGRQPIPVPLKTVAIAWKPTREAARAVAVAMPFIERAARVAILTISARDGAVEADSAQHLAATLRRHGPSVEVRSETDSAGGGPETLLRAAAECADLLVMGAYGHSRFREMVFGGFTEQVLTRADLPVVMAH
jgi:nucleotide-binding universal stress UspA family protein